MYTLSVYISIDDAVSTTAPSEVSHGRRMPTYLPGYLTRSTMIRTDGRIFGLGSQQRSDHNFRHAGADEGPYETKIPHRIDFIEAVRQRKDPVVPAETGHSSCTVCTLGNIAVDLMRTIKWDPATETFVDDVDGAAAKKLHYDYREPWKLI